MKINKMLNNYKNILNDNTFVYIDIGSRDGMSPEWDQVKSLVQVVMFEPDEFEAKRLQKNMKNNEIVIPKGIWSYNGKVKFHSNRNPSYSSVLKPNREILEGTFYYCRNFYELKEIIEIEVKLLESILSDYGINRYDFLKIDIQGAEHHIFDTLSNWESIIGIHTEAYGAKLYLEGSDISNTLKKIYDENFELYDISVIADAPIVEINNKNVFSKELLNARPRSGYRSRPIVYDLLLFKNNTKILNTNNIILIRKMIFVLCVYKFFDYALNLTLKSFEKNFFSLEEKDLIVDSIKILHKQSLSKFQRLKETIKAPSYQLRKR